MPKEKITTQTYLAGEETINANNDVLIGWYQDCSVQIGLQDPEQRSLLWKLFGSKEQRDHWAPQLIEYIQGLNLDLVDSKEEFADNVAKDILDIIEGYTLSVHSIWADLTRDEVNKFIKVLRRARDQAFGRDE